MTIRFGGYTDNTGDPKVNLNLSQQREESVTRELVNLGVDAVGLKAEGYDQEIQRLTTAAKKAAPKTGGLISGPPAGKTIC